MSQVQQRPRVMFFHSPTKHFCLGSYPHVIVVKHIQAVEMETTWPLHRHQKFPNPKAHPKVCQELGCVGGFTYKGQNSRQKKWTIKARQTLGHVWPNCAPFGMKTTKKMDKNKPYRRTTMVSAKDSFCMIGSKLGWHKVARCIVLMSLRAC